MGDDVKPAPARVRSNSRLAAGVSISTRLGVDAPSAPLPVDGDGDAGAFFLGTAPPKRPARFDSALPASLPSRLPSASRAFGALMVKGEGAESAGSSDPDRRRGVARSVPQVMSSLTR